MAKFKTLLSNNWTVTLVGILIGGFAGVYFNGSFQIRKEKQEKSVAYERVMEELADNYDRLIIWDSITKPYYNCIHDISNFLVDEGQSLVLDQTQRSDLLQKYSDFLQIADTVEVLSNHKVKYGWSTSLQVDLTMAIFPYDNIAWQSMKNSQYLKYLEFDCITEIEQLYQTFEQIGVNRNKWFEQYLTKSLSVSEGREVRLYWSLERTFNEVIINTYPNVMVRLKKCH